MFNQIYEQDYTTIREDRAFSPDSQERRKLLDFSISSGVLNAMGDSFNQLPREINDEKLDK